MSHSHKLIKPGGGGGGLRKLQFVAKLKVLSNLVIGIASGGRAILWEVRHYLRVDGVNIKLNSKTLSWYCRDMLGVRKTHMHLMTRSHVFPLQVKERHSKDLAGKKWGFSSIQEVE